MWCEGTQYLLVFDVQGEKGFEIPSNLKANSLLTWQGRPQVLKHLLNDQILARPTFTQ